MYIIIVGAGTVGLNLAKHLCGEGHDIYLIDSDSGRVQEIEENKTLDVMVKFGNGGTPDMLLEAGVEKADLLVAVTHSDETNIISCMIASTLGAERRIARVRSDAYFKRNTILQPMDLGIDLLINPEDEVAREIVYLLERPYATQRKLIFKGRLEMVGLPISESCTLAERKLKDVPGLVEPDFRLSLILRDKQPIIPNGETTIRTGDEVFFLAESSRIDSLVAKINVGGRPIENLFIIGGGTIGVKIAAHYESQKNTRVRLVENKREKALKLSEILSRTIVLEGDGTNMDLLLSEGFREADAFISATDKEEVNILSCLMAHQQGIPTNVAVVQRQEFLPLINAMKLSVISPTAITIDKILRFVRGENVLSISTLANESAEVLEFKVKEDSKIAGKAIRDIRCPENAVFSAIIRKDQALIPTGTTIIEKEDHVFIFALKSDVEKVQTLF